MSETMIVCEHVAFMFYISPDITDVKVQCGIQMKRRVIRKRIVVAQWSYHLSIVITAKEMKNISTRMHTFLMQADNMLLLKLVYVHFQYIQS